MSRIRFSARRADESFVEIEASQLEVIGEFGTVRTVVWEGQGQEAPPTRLNSSDIGMVSEQNYDTPVRVIGFSPFQ